MRAAITILTLVIATSVCSAQDPSALAGEIAWAESSLKADQPVKAYNQLAAVRAKTLKALAADLKSAMPEPPTGWELVHSGLPFYSNSRIDLVWVPAGQKRWNKVRIQLYLHLEPDLSSFHRKYARAKRSGEVTETKIGEAPALLNDDAKRKRLRLTGAVGPVLVVLEGRGVERDTVLQLGKRLDTKALVARLGKPTAEGLDAQLAEAKTLLSERKLGAAAITLARALVTIGERAAGQLQPVMPAAREGWVRVFPRKPNKGSMRLLAAAPSVIDVVYIKGTPRRPGRWYGEPHTRVRLHLKDSVMVGTWDRDLRGTHELARNFSRLTVSGRKAIIRKSKKGDLKLIVQVQPRIVLEYSAQKISHEELLAIAQAVDLAKLDSLLSQ